VTVTVTVTVPVAVAIYSSRNNHEEWMPCLSPMSVSSVGRVSD
jgi:hypothetical protein